MNSDVELARGFSFWIRLAGTPVAAAITANVSPARTVQNLEEDRAFVVEPGVVETRVWGSGGALVELEPEPPDSKPERTRTTAIVTASRNATGAA